MRIARDTVFLVALVLGVGLAFVAASARTPDGETPAEESVCDGTTGAAFGLCNAYCEAQDCDVHDRKSCERLRKRYKKKTGTDVFPCDGRCGDGLVNLDFEECDDGNNEPGDGCSPSCRVEFCPVEFCGDGVVDLDLGEQCEVDDDCLVFGTSDDFVCSADCGCVTQLFQTCKQLDQFGRDAIAEYLKAVDDFRAGGGTTCQDLMDAYDLVNANVDRCRAACGVLPCPSKPLGPGSYPGTEACGIT